MKKYYFIGLIILFIGIITFFFFKNEITPNLKYKKEVSFYVIVATLIYFVIYFSLGYLKGFAHNPYDGTINGLLLNLWTFIPVILVKEYVRFYMINNVGIEMPVTALFGMIFGCYIVINECISIAENLYMINPAILPKWIVKMLSAAKEQIDKKG